MTRPTRKDIRNTISEILANMDLLKTGDPITYEHRPVDDLGLDSLDMIELAIVLDEQYDIDLPDREFTESSRLTIGDLCDEVLDRLPK